MAELSNLLSADDAVVEKNIDVEMLDYDYIRKCKDGKILKSIVGIL